MVKAVYNLVKKHPAIKLYLKNVYQAVNLLVSRQRPDMQAVQSVAENFFFGFHDKCPWDYNDLRVLAHKAPHNEKARLRGEPVQIGFFSDDTLSQFNVIAETGAWNWQQGSMLQWDPDSNAIYFNDIDNTSSPRLIKIGLEDSRREVVGPATASISPDGQYSASISFFRFGKGLPGYGYFGIKEEEGDIGIPEKNGALELFNLETKEHNPFLKIGIRQCMQIKELQSMIGAYHYISHPQFSPDSKKLAFFHRWFHKGKRVETHLFYLDLKTRELTAADTGSMFSHFCWLDNKRVFGFYEDTSGLDRYGVLNCCKSGDEQVKSSFLNVDGHPNAHWETGKVITDTYPDKSRLQNLILLEGSINEPNGRIVGSFYAPFKFQEIFRADLHPRWNRAGDKIAVDCSFPGKRSLAIVAV